MYSHCATGGWILGNTIDGTQAEFVRTPHADTSLYPIPGGLDEEAPGPDAGGHPAHGFKMRRSQRRRFSRGGTVGIVSFRAPSAWRHCTTAHSTARHAQIITSIVDDSRLDVARQFGGRHGQQRWTAKPPRLMENDRGIRASMRSRQWSVPYTSSFLPRRSVARGQEDDTLISVRKQGGPASGKSLGGPQHHHHHPSWSIRSAHPCCSMCWRRARSIPDN